MSLPARLERGEPVFEPTQPKRLGDELRACLGELLEQEANDRRVGGWGMVVVGWSLKQPGALGALVTVLGAHAAPIASRMAATWGYRREVSAPASTEVTNGVSRLFAVSMSSSSQRYVDSLAA